MMKITCLFDHLFKCLHMANNGIEIDTTPLYWPETFEPYPEPPEDYYMDSVNMDCGD